MKMSIKRTVYLCPLPYFKIYNIPIEFDINSGTGFVISICLLVVGIIVMLIGASLHTKMLRSALIYLQGLPKMSPVAPLDSIRKPYSLYNPHPTILKISDDSPKKAIENINEDCRVLISQVLTNGDYSKVFFAGLARVPCLFAIATFFRAASANIEVLDSFRSSNGWKHLKELETTDAPIIELTGDLDSSVSPTGELGICIEITSKIEENELPEYIQQHSVCFKLTPKTTPEAFTVESHIEYFCLKVKQFLDSATKKATTIHLFISAQSSVVFTLGRMYQEGMHGTLVIHNYDPITKSYPWAFQIKKGSITLYNR